MAREMKIGIAVIGVLLVVFCGLLAKRLTRPSKLPLASINSSTDNPDSRVVKPSSPPDRPIVVTPQAEPTQTTETKWAADTARNRIDESSWSKPQDRYAAMPYSWDGAHQANGSAMGESSTPQTSVANADQPPLLSAAPLPIRDAEHEPSGDSNDTMHHQTGYAATDDQSGNANRPAAEMRHTEDPFQRKASHRRRSTGVSEPPQSSRYQGSVDIDKSGSTFTGNQYQYGGYRSANPPRSSTTNDRDMPTSAGANNERNGGASETTARSQEADLNRSTATSSFGASQTTTTSSGWPSTAMTGSIVPSDSAPPIQRDGEQYSVQPNDTFWSISERAYGTGAFFKALYEYNRKRHKLADELVVGQELLVPDENVLRRSYPDLCPRLRKNIASTEQRLISVSTKLRGGGRVYKVVEGDTLFEIARYELGKPSRWAEIYELNRDVLGDDFDYLRPGTELILPVDAPRDSVTQQPGFNYPR